MFYSLSDVSKTRTNILQTLRLFYCIDRNLQSRHDHDHVRASYCTVIGIVLIIISLRLTPLNAEMSGTHVLLCTQCTCMKYIHTHVLHTDWVNLNSDSRVLESVILTLENFMLLADVLKRIFN